MYNYILLRNLEFHVFNIRERGLHVFEELQKRNNIHIYIRFRENPLSRGRRKSARINTFLPPKVCKSYWARPHFTRKRNETLL